MDPFDLKCLFGKLKISLKFILKDDNVMTYPVFSFTNLEDLELLSTGTLCHLSLDLVVNSLGVGERTSLLPVRSEGGHELSPVDHAVTVVELVGHSVQLKLA